MHEIIGFYEMTEPDVTEGIDVESFTKGVAIDLTVHVSGLQPGFLTMGLEGLKKPNGWVPLLRTLVFTEDGIAGLDFSCELISRLRIRWIDGKATQVRCELTLMEPMNPKGLAMRGSPVLHEKPIAVTHGELITFKGENLAASIVLFSDRIYQPPEFNSDTEVRVLVPEKAITGTVFIVNAMGIINAGMITVI